VQADRRAGTVKRSERHHLKENELVAFVDRSREVLAQRRREIVAVIVAVVVVLVAVMGYIAWRNNTEGKAAALLTDAEAVLEAQVTTPAPAAAGQPAPKPPAGTYPSEQAKLEAALPKLAAVYTKYPSTDSGIAARYYAANALAAVGRRSEAEARYQEVIAKGGVYAEMARLGLANVLANAGQHDRAITIYKEITAEPKADVPVDGVLMQLGRAYARAGRRSEAQQTYTRIVQEFPESLYAADARKELEALKKS
jgi:tetratricopeptide (TPR) repeat protein